MKANRHARTTENDRAEVGIGTMIVFIAAVIVAAIAAAVLVNTAGNLQRKASETGGDTTQEVAANMFVRDILGYDEGTDDDLDEIYIYVSLAPGADPIDLNQTIIRWKHSTNNTNVGVGSSTTCDTSNYGNLSHGFCVARVEESSGDGNRYVLSEGDRVRIEIHLGEETASTAETVSTRSTVDLLLIPEEGSPVDASFNTPPTYGAEDYVPLT